MDPRELHIDRALTTFSMKYSQIGLIGDKVLPRVGVQKLSDKFKVYKTDDLKRIDTILHDKAEPRLFDWGLGDDDTYNLQSYGLHDYVSQSDMENADKPINAMQDTVAAMLDALLLDKEYRIKTLVCTAGSYGTNNKKTLSGTSRWDDYSSGVSDPIGNIKAAKAAVRASCGRPANTIIMDYKVALTLAHHPDIIDLVKYTDKTLLSNGGLPPTLFGLRVLEAGSIYDSVLRGQTMSLSALWGTFVLIAHINPRPTIKTITLGVSFQKGTRKTSKIWDEKIGPNGAWYVKQTLPQQDEKLITANCGYLIITAIS